MASSASDRTVNKIALCGAIFAGVAYVGYSVVKQAFGKTFYKGDKKKEGKMKWIIVWTLMFRFVVPFPKNDEIIFREVFLNANY